MPATSGYQAGTEANATQLSYGVEAVWGTPPATTFQAIRYTSENLADAKTRTRPSEINTAREVSAAVTTQESASGSINYALSYGTFDDFISVVLGSDWQAPQTIAGVAGDITLTNVSATAASLSSTTAGKFTNLGVGQWVRILGFSNTANNGFVRISAKTDAQHLMVATLVAAVTETPDGAAAQLRAQTIMNGMQFKSLFIQQRLASDLWLRYPGCYVSAWTLAGGIGQFMNGAFSILAQQEINQTADVSTGGILAAPTGKVMDPVGGFGGVLWNEVPVLATVDSFNLSFSNTGAAQEFGMGSSLAAGVLAGSMEVTGSIKMYFRDFTIYSRFKAETSGSLAFIMKDNASNAYIITLPSALLLNAQIAAGGPGQPVWATFQIEGNPQAGGGTVIVDKLPAI